MEKITFPLYLTNKLFSYAICKEGREQPGLCMYLSWWYFGLISIGLFVLIFFLPRVCLCMPITKIYTDDFWENKQSINYYRRLDLNLEIWFFVYAIIYSTCLKDPQFFGLCGETCYSRFIRELVCHFVLRNLEHNVPKYKATDLKTNFYILHGLLITKKQHIPKTLQYAKRYMHWGPYIYRRYLCGIWYLWGIVSCIFL